jgi:hypothetical protein
LIKANNKLIGTIENNDLYGSDDGMAKEAAPEEVEQTGGELDIEMKQAPKMAVNTFLAKIRKVPGDGILNQI